MMVKVLLGISILIFILLFWYTAKEDKNDTY